MSGSRIFKPISNYLASRLQPGGLPRLKRADSAWSNRALSPGSSRETGIRGGTPGARGTSLIKSAQAEAGLDELRAASRLDAQNASVFERIGDVEKSLNHAAEARG